MGITITCSYSLLTRLFPRSFGVEDDFGAYRLASPLGYWNALGVFAVIGMLLALGFAARSRSIAVRALAAASIVVLATTLYFTYSRGSWVALAVALVVLVLLDARRLQLVTAFAVVAPWSAFAVWHASGIGQLTRTDHTLAGAAADGRRFAFDLVALMIVAAAAAVAYAIAERRVRVPRNVRLAYVAVLALLVVAACGAAIDRYGSPPTMARDGYNALLGANKHDDERRSQQPPLRPRAQRPHAPLAGRLGRVRRPSLARHGRGQLRALLEPVPHRELQGDQRAQPLPRDAGRTGAGRPRAPRARARSTARRRGPRPQARDSCPPRRRRTSPSSCTRSSTGTGRSRPSRSRPCSAASDCSSPPGASRCPSSRSAPSGSALALAVVVVLAAAAFVGLRGNQAIAASERATEVGNWDRGIAQARSARTWAPWSAQPWQLLGEAQFQSGDTAAARASFEQAVAKDPADWGNWLSLAIASSGAEQAPRRPRGAGAQSSQPGDRVVAAGARGRCGECGVVIRSPIRRR